MESLKNFSLEYYVNLIEQSDIETDIITTLVENNIGDSALLEKVQIKNGSMNLSLKGMGKKIKELVLKVFLFFKKIFIAIKAKIKEKSDIRLKELAVIEKEAKVVIKDYLSDVKDSHIEYVDILPELDNGSYLNNLTIISKILSKLMKKINDKVSDQASKINGVPTYNIGEVLGSLEELSHQMFNFLPDGTIDLILDKLDAASSSWGLEKYSDDKEIFDAMSSIKMVASSSEAIGAASVFKNGKKIIQSIIKKHGSGRSDNIIKLLYGIFRTGYQKEINSVYDVQNIVAQAKLSLMNEIKYFKVLSSIQADLDLCIAMIDKWDIDENDDTIISIVDMYKDIVNSVYTYIKGISLGASKKYFNIYIVSVNSLINMIMKVSEADNKYTCNNQTVLNYYNNKSDSNKDTEFNDIDD